MKKTKDYTMFGKILGNRDLNQGHVKKLEESIIKNNLLYANPIIVTKAYDVVDGQHRLEVAKNNNLDIYYITVDEEEALRLVRQLNTVVKGWSLMNFIDGNIKLGNENYQILKDFAETYGLPLMQAADLLSGAKYNSGNYKRKGVVEFKEGLFKVKGLKKAMILAENLNLAKPYVNGVWKDRNFLRALQEAFEVVNKKKMIKKLATCPLKVVRQAGVKEYLRNLEEIYNWRLSEKNRVRFF